MTSMDTKITRAVSFITIGIVASKILGFVREMSIAAGFGATIKTDAYFLAMTLPLILFSSVSNSITTTFIPLFTEIVQTKGEEQAMKFCNNILNVIIVISLLISGLGIIFGDKIVPLVALGYKGEALRLTVFLTRIMFPIVVVMGISGIITGFLNSQQKFFIPAITWMPHNLVIIAYCLFFNSTYGIEGLAWVTLLASASQILIQLPLAYKLGFRYRFVLNIKDEYVRRVGILIIPVIIGVGINQINVLIDKMLASSLENGSITALNFANKLFYLPLGIFVVSIITAIFPELSKLSSLNKLDEIKQMMLKALRVVIVLLIPITVGMMVIRYPLIRLLFERGQFDERDTVLTAIALFYFSIGIIGFAARDILNRVYYSLQDTTTPMKNGIISVILNIVLNLILIRYMALGGLAFSTSVASIVTVCMLLNNLNKKFNGIDIKGLIIFFSKIVAISCVMGLVVHEFITLLPGHSSMFYVAGSGLLGMVIYTALLKVLKIEELEWLLDIVSQKLHKSRHLPAHSNK